MPQFVLKRRDLLGITMTGAAVLFWKPSKAKALGGKLPEIGEKAPGFDLPGTLGGARQKTGNSTTGPVVGWCFIFIREISRLVARLKLTASRNHSKSSTLISAMSQQFQLTALMIMNHFAAAKDWTSRCYPTQKAKSVESMGRGWPLTHYGIRF